MIGKASKNQTRTKIHTRIRKKIAGTTERPRLSIYRSVSHVYAQVIDDSKGETLASAGTVEKGKGQKGESARPAATLPRPRKSAN